MHNEHLQEIEIVLESDRNDLKGLAVKRSGPDSSDLSKRRIPNSEPLPIGIGMEPPSSSIPPVRQSSIRNDTNRAQIREKHYRSLTKALSWRLTGTLDTIILCFLITGKFKVAISVGVVELFTKIGLYYLHERVWNRISFGRVKETPPEYSI